MECKCHDGFVSSGSTLTRILKQYDLSFCVPAMQSDAVITTHDSITLHLEEEFLGDVELFRHGK